MSERNKTCGLDAAQSCPSLCPGIVRLPGGQFSCSTRRLVADRGEVYGQDEGWVPKAPIHYIVQIGNQPTYSRFTEAA